MVCNSKVIVPVTHSLSVNRQLNIAKKQRRGHATPKNSSFSQNFVFVAKPPPLIHALNYNPIKDKAVCVRGLGPLINSVNKN